MKLTRNTLLLIAWASAPCLTHAATPKTLALTQAAAESSALQSSSRLRSAGAEVHAAEAQADSQFATLLPQLRLEASYRYQSVVPQLTLPGGPPGAPPLILNFGSTSSYSIGPTLSYTVWDGGASRKGYQGASRLLEARQADAENSRNQVLMSVRVAYVKVQLAIEELRLTADSLKTAQVQNTDVGKRFRAGASSQLDTLSAHREVLNYELQFRQHQADLAQALEDLTDATGAQGTLAVTDVSSPYAPEILDLQVSGVPEPTLLVELDPLAASIAQFSTQSWISPGPDHPELRAQRLSAEATDLAADGTDGALWPAIQLTARTSLDYPNGPILERINQNTVGVSLSMPLFEWDRTRKAAEGKHAEAESARFLHDQAELDLKRDWRKAMDQLESLRAQDGFARQSVKEAETEAKLSYDSYRLGRMSLVDVQNADFRALEAKVSAARIEAQTLLQIYQLAVLSGKGT